MEPSSIDMAQPPLPMPPAPNIAPEGDLDEDSAMRNQAMEDAIADTPEDPAPQVRPRRSKRLQDANNNERKWERDNNGRMRRINFSSMTCQEKTK